MEKIVIKEVIKTVEKEVVVMKEKIKVEQQIKEVPIFNTTVKVEKVEIEKPVITERAVEI